MKQNVSYSLILNKVQADYLSASKYGINRMQALVTRKEASLPPSRSASSSPPRWSCPGFGSATARPYPESWTR